MERNEYRKMQRTKQSVKNASFSLICQAVQLVVQMVTRVVFIQVIGKEYLGLNGLFTDLLTALQLVELGVGPAIAYSLYKPLAENDKEKIKSLMNLFKKAYMFIGVFIIVVGIFFTPFYRFFINEVPDIQHLDLIYLLFVLNTAISYFGSYYRTLIISDQKKYIDTLVHTGTVSAVSIAQMGILFLTHNYILYIIAQIVGTILINIILSRIALKQYPYLKEKQVEKLDKESYGEIKKNIFAMVFHKVGSIIRDATDNLIISKYIGLAITGMYSNYSLITKALSNIINQIFSAVLSSVGNLHVTTDEKTQKVVFNKINFLNFWIASFCAVCFGILIEPFILIIADETYLLGNIVAILITLRFYFDIMRKTPWMFCEAAGIYWKGKTKPLWEVLVNLVISIVLVKQIGVAGVFIGTIATILLVDLTVEPYLAFKYVLKEGLLKYYIRYLAYFLVTVIMYIASYWVCSLIPNIGILTFVVKGIVTAIITNLLIVITMFRTDEFKYAIGLAKNLIQPFLNKITNKRSEQE